MSSQENFVPISYYLYDKPLGTNFVEEAQMMLKHEISALIEEAVHKAVHGDVDASYDVSDFFTVEMVSKEGKHYKGVLYRKGSE